MLLYAQDYPDSSTEMGYKEVSIEAKNESNFNDHQTIWSCPLHTVQNNRAVFYLVSEGKLHVWRGFEADIQTKQKVCKLLGGELKILGGGGGNFPP